MVKACIMTEKKCYFGGKPIGYDFTFICCIRLKYANSVKILNNKNLLKL